MTAEAWEILGVPKREGGHQRGKYVGHDSDSILTDARGGWHDFKTGKGSAKNDDPSTAAIKARMYVSGVSFAEAAAEIRGREYIPPPLELLTRYWHKQLRPQDREFIRQKWGLDDKTIDRAQLGRITGTLPKVVTVSDARKVGLIKEKSSRIQGFRGYLAIPWLENGRPVHFSARALPDIDWGTDADGKPCEIPKTLQPKGSRPWSYGTAPDTTRDGYIVEGYGDALAIGAPVRAIVSNKPRGDTIKQIADWGRHCLRLVLCLDGDEAGLKGTEKTGRALLKAGALAYVAPLPEGLDPAEHLKWDGSRESLSGSAVPFPAWLVHRLTVPQQCAEIASGLARLTKADRAVALGATVDAVVERFGMGKREARALLSNLRSINGGAEEQPRRDGDPTTLYGAVEAGPHGYISHAGDEPVLISGFTLTLTSILEMPNGDTVYRCAAHVAGEERGPLDLRMSAFADSRAFLAALKPIQSYGGTWTGSNAHVQGVLALLSQQAAELPRQVASPCLGWRTDSEGRAAWVSPHETLGPGAEGVAWLDKQQHLPGRIQPLTESATPEQCLAVLDAMWDVATPDTLAAPLICWAFGSLIAPVIRSHTRAGTFPSLMLAGLQGGGKTTLAQQCVSRLAGWADTSIAPYMASGKIFGLLSVLTGTTGPVHIDEYDPRNLTDRSKANWEDWINLNYSGGVDMRGNRDRSIDEYRMTAALLLTGETKPARPSLLERIVFLRPPKDRLGPHSREALHRLKSLPAQAVGRNFIEWALTFDFDVFDWESWRGIARGYDWGETLPDRPSANLDTLCASYAIIWAWCASMAIAPKISEQEGMDALIEGYRISAEQTYGPQGRETELDQAMRAAALYAGVSLEYGTDIRLSGDKLLIRVERLCQVWAQQAARGRERGAPAPQVIKDAAKEAQGDAASYVEDASSVRKMGATKQRVLVVDTAKLEKALQIPAESWREDVEYGAD